MWCLSILCSYNHFSYLRKVFQKVWEKILGQSSRGPFVRSDTDVGQEGLAVSLCFNSPHSWSQHSFSTPNPDSSIGFGSRIIWPVQPCWSLVEARPAALHPAVCAAATQLCGPNPGRTSLNLRLVLSETGWTCQHCNFWKIWCTFARFYQRTNIWMFLSVSPPLGCSQMREQQERCRNVATRLRWVKEAVAAEQAVETGTVQLICKAGRVSSSRSKCKVTLKKLP